MESKLLIIAKGDKRELTFNEVFKMYENLINKETNKWTNRYEYDDLFQIASVGLWNAYKAYDINKRIGFGLLAKTCITRELLRNNQLKGPKFNKKCSLVKSITSMEKPIAINSKGHELKLKDLVAEDDFAKVTIDKIAVNNALKRLTNDEVEDINLYLQGFKIREVAEKRNMKYSTATLRKKRILNKIKKSYLEEMVLA